MQSVHEISMEIIRTSTEFQLAVDRSDTTAAIKLWDTSPLLQSCLSGEFQQYSSLHVGIMVLEKALQQQWTPLAERLLTKPGLQKWYVQKAVKFFESSLINKQFSQALNQLKQFTFIELWYSNPNDFPFSQDGISTDSWKLLEAAAESKNTVLIQTICRKQNLQFCLKDQIGKMAIPVDVQVRIFQMSAEQQLTSITDFLLDNWQNQPQPQTTGNLPAFECNAAFVEAIVNFENSLLKKIPDAQIALELLRKNPQISLIYSCQYIFPINREGVSKKKIWNIFEAALKSENKPLIYMVWENNQKLQSLLMNPSLPHTKLTNGVQINIYKRASLLKLTAITNRLLTNPLLKEWHEVNLKNINEKADNTARPSQLNTKSAPVIDFQLIDVISSFISALESKNIESILEKWNNNVILQNCLAVNIQVFLIPSAMRAHIFQMASELKLTEITSYMTNPASSISLNMPPICSSQSARGINPDKVFMDAIIGFESALLDGSILEAIKTLEKFPDFFNGDKYNQTRQKIISKTEIWKLFEAALKTTRIPILIIKALWKNPELKSCLKCEVPGMVIPLKHLIAMFSASYNNIIPSISKTLWKSNQNLRDWFMYKNVNMNVPDMPDMQRISLSELIKEHKRLWVSKGKNKTFLKKIAVKIYKQVPELQDWYQGLILNMGTSEMPENKIIPIQDLIDFIRNLTPFFDKEDPAFEKIYSDTRIQRWYTGAVVNFGTIPNPINKRLHINAILERFLFLLNSESRPQQLLILMADIPEIQAYLKGWPVNTGIEVLPPLATEQLVDQLSLIIQNCPSIMMNSWRDNLVLQNAVYSMKYQQFKSLLKKIIHFALPSLEEFISSFSNMILLQNFLRNERQNKYVQTRILIQKRIKNSDLNTLNLDTTKDIQSLSYLLNLMPKEVIVSNDKIEIPSNLVEPLHNNYLLKQQLGIMHILDLGTYCYLQVRDVKLYNAFLSAFLQQPIEPIIQVPYGHKPMILEMAIGKFTKALLDTNPIKLNTVITLWAEYPDLACWFLGKEMDCFGIKNNRIQVKELLPCFLAALSYPLECVYILRQMLKNSLELQQYIRELPETTLLYYFNQILKSKSITLLNLIWSENVKLHKTLKDLSYQDAKQELKTVLQEVKSLNTSSKRDFVTSYCNNIDNMALLEDVLEELSNSKQKSLIEMRIFYLRNLAHSQLSLKRVNEFESESPRKKLKTNIQMNINPQVPEIYLAHTLDYECEDYNALEFKKVESVDTISPNNPYRLFQLNDKNNDSLACDNSWDLEKP